MGLMIHALVSGGGSLVRSVPVSVAAIAAVTIIAVASILQGIDGNTIATAIVAVTAIAGVHLGQFLARRDP